MRHFSWPRLHLLCVQPSQLCLRRLHCRRLSELGPIAVSKAPFMSPGTLIALAISITAARSKNFQSGCCHRVRPFALRNLLLWELWDYEVDEPCLGSLWSVLPLPKMTHSKCFLLCLCAGTQWCTPTPARCLCSSIMSSKLRQTMLSITAFLRQQWSCRELFSNVLVKAKKERLIRATYGQRTHVSKVVCGSECLSRHHLCDVEITTLCLQTRKLRGRIEDQFK